LKTKFLISLLLIVSLITSFSAVSSQKETTMAIQNMTQNSRKEYQVTFDFEVVDAFTNRPLRGGLAIYAVCNDTLWQEELEWGEWKHLGTYEFENGRIRVRLPLHGLYGFEIWAEEGEADSPYGVLPFYEEVWRTYRFDGNLSAKIRVELYPVGYVVAKLYDPSGRKLVFKTEDELIEFNAGQFYGSHDYRHFTRYHYLEDSGMLAVRVPANKPSKIYWMTHVPGYGFAWLEADNGGKGYLVDKGRYVTVNLIYDSAVTMLNKAKSFVSTLRSQNIPLSANVTEMLENAETLLSSAEGRGDSEKAVSGWRALRETLRAWEQAILDYSRHRIDKHRMGVIALDLPEGFRATISLDYLDFVLGPGWSPEEAGSYWRELQRFSKTGLQWAITPYHAMRRDGSVPGEAVFEQVRDFKERLGFERLFAEIHDFRYPSPADIYGSDIPEPILKDLRIYNLTKTIEMSKNLARSLITAVKKYNISFEGYMVAVEYDQPFLYDYKWRIFNGMEYLSPPRMEERLTWLKEVAGYVKELDPNARIYTYLSGLIPNPFTISAHEEWIGYQTYSSTHLIEGAKYFIDHGAPIDVVGFQIHILLSFADPLNPIDLYYFVDELEKSLPGDVGFYAAEFTTTSRPTDDFSAFEGSESIDESYQAELLRKAITILLGSPRFEGLDFTLSLDTADKAEGYLRADGTPKPAFFAVKDLFDSLVYEGEYPGAPVKTLAGWYNISLYSPDGRLIGTYRVHVDGGSKTTFIFHIYENETVKAEVEKLEQRLEEAREEIVSLENEVQALKRDLQDKEALIAELRERFSENVTVTTRTITSAITKTIVLQESRLPIPDTLIIAGALITLVAAVMMIYIWKREKK